MSGSSPSDGAEHELLLLLCGTQKRRLAHVGRIRELARGVDPETFLTLLASQRLVELAGSRLLEHAPEEAPHRVLDAAAAVLAANRVRALALEAATDLILRRLGAGGVRAIALKGPDLARLIYRDPGLRTAGDVDLLVAAADLPAAVESACALGYMRPVDPVDRDGLPALHFELFHSSLPPLELHWRTHWLEREFADHVLERAEPGSDGRLRVSPVDGMALLLAFYARDGFAGLRLAADIAGWWDRFGAELPEGALEPLVTRHPALQEAWSAAAGVAQSVAGVPAGKLLPRAEPSRGARVAQRLANWPLRGDPDQVQANILLVDGLLGPAGGSREFVMHKVFPSLATLRHGYGLSAAGALRIRFARVGHGVRHLARFGLALWAVRRGRFYARLPADAGVS